ncbi:uncharacterized protein LOC106079458 isoform X3 [Biomphalaria glabrata]|uniref:Uncharacterized protein LOC106079458 isoform X3 n=1 Tax=Biomphalaria glabrata TaxID=6526 RepID=A0A9W2YHH3_BIOGL|nr:uncharacterized protein LOC106079458 isoform X3 [Biomphalaria glabrata]
MTECRPYQRRSAFTYMAQRSPDQRASYETEEELQSTYYDLADVCDNGSQNNPTLGHCVKKKSTLERLCNTSSNPYPLVIVPGYEGEGHTHNYFEVCQNEKLHEDRKCGQNTRNAMVPKDGSCEAFHSPKGIGQLEKDDESLYSIQSRRPKRSTSTDSEINLNRARLFRTKRNDHHCQRTRRRSFSAEKSVHNKRPPKEERAAKAFKEEKHGVKTFKVSGYSDSRTVRARFYTPPLIKEKGAEAQHRHRNKTGKTTGTVGQESPRHLKGWNVKQCQETGQEKQVHYQLEPGGHHVTNEGLGKNRAHLSSSPKSKKKVVLRTGKEAYSKYPSISVKSSNLSSNTNDSANNTAISSTLVVGNMTSMDDASLQKFCNGETVHLKRGLANSCALETFQEAIVEMPEMNITAARGKSRYQEMDDSTSNAVGGENAELLNYRGQFYEQNALRWHSPVTDNYIPCNVLSDKARMSRRSRRVRYAELKCFPDHNITTSSQRYRVPKREKQLGAHPLYGSSFAARKAPPTKLVTGKAPKDNRRLVKSPSQIEEMENRKSLALQRRLKVLRRSHEASTSEAAKKLDRREFLEKKRKEKDDIVETLQKDNASEAGGNQNVVSQTVSESVSLVDIKDGPSDLPRTSIQRDVIVTHESTVNGPKDSENRLFLKSNSVLLQSSSKVVDTKQRSSQDSHLTHPTYLQPKINLSTIQEADSAKSGGQSHVVSELRMQPSGILKNSTSHLDRLLSVTGSGRMSVAMGAGKRLSTDNPTEVDKLESMHRTLARRSSREDEFRKPESHQEVQKVSSQFAHRKSEHGSRDALGDTNAERRFSVSNTATIESRRASINKRSTLIEESGNQESQPNFKTSTSHFVPMRSGTASRRESEVFAADKKISVNNAEAIESIRKSLTESERDSRHTIVSTQRPSIVTSVNVAHKSSPSSPKTKTATPLSQDKSKLNYSDFKESRTEIRAVPSNADNMRSNRNTIEISTKASTNVPEMPSNRFKSSEQQFVNALDRLPNNRSSQIAMPMSPSSHAKTQIPTQHDNEGLENSEYRFRGQSSKIVLQREESQKMLANTSNVSSADIRLDKKDSCNVDYKSLVKLDTQECFVENRHYQQSEQEQAISSRPVNKSRDNIQCSSSLAPLDGKWFITREVENPANSLLELQNYKESHDRLSTDNRRANTPNSQNYYLNIKESKTRTSKEIGSAVSITAVGIIKSPIRSPQSRTAIQTPLSAKSSQARTLSKHDGLHENVHYESVSESGVGNIQVSRKTLKENASLSKTKMMKKEPASPTSLSMKSDVDQTDSPQWISPVRSGSKRKYSGIFFHESPDNSRRSSPPFRYHKNPKCLQRTGKSSDAQVREFNAQFVSSSADKTTKDAISDSYSGGKEKHSLYKSSEKTSTEVTPCGIRSARTSHDTVSKTPMLNTKSLFDQPLSRKNSDVSPTNQPRRDCMEKCVQCIEQGAARRTFSVDEIEDKKALDRKTSTNLSFTKTMNSLKANSSTQVGGLRLPRRLTSDMKRVSIQPSPLFQPLFQSIFSGCLSDTNRKVNSKSATLAGHGMSSDPEDNLDPFSRWKNSKRSKDLEVIKKPGEGKGTASSYYDNLRSEMYHSKDRDGASSLKKGCAKNNECCLERNETFVRKQKAKSGRGNCSYLSGESHLLCRDCKIYSDKIPQELNSAMKEVTWRDDHGRSVCLSPPSGSQHIRRDYPADSAHEVSRSRKFSKDSGSRVDAVASGRSDNGFPVSMSSRGRPAFKTRDDLDGSLTDEDYYSSKSCYSSYRTSSTSPYQRDKSKRVDKVGFQRSYTSLLQPTGREDQSAKYIPKSYTLRKQCDLSEEKCAQSRSARHSLSRASCASDIDMYSTSSYSDNQRPLSPKCCSVHRTASNSPDSYYECQSRRLNDSCQSEPHSCNYRHHDICRKRLRGETAFEVYAAKKKDKDKGKSSDAKRKGHSDEAKSSTKEKKDRGKKGKDKDLEPASDPVRRPVSEISLERPVSKHNEVKVGKEKDKGESLGRKSSKSEMDMKGEEDTTKIGKSFSTSFAPNTESPPLSKSEKKNSKNHILLTHYISSMNYINASSAAGVAWSGLAYKPPTRNESQSSKSSKKGKPGDQSEDCPEGNVSKVDVVQIVFCDPYQAHRFRIVVETLQCAFTENECILVTCHKHGCPPGPPMVPTALVDPCSTNVYSQPCVSPGFIPMSAAGFVPCPSKSCDGAPTVTSMSSPCPVSWGNSQFEPNSPQGMMGASNGGENQRNLGPEDIYDPYSYEHCMEKVLFCSVACLVKLAKDQTWIEMQQGTVTIKQCANGMGFTLTFEGAAKCGAVSHYIRRDTVFERAPRTQHGFIYNTIFCGDKGSFVEEYLISFQSKNQAECFKLVVDRCHKLLMMTASRQSEQSCPCNGALSMFRPQCGNNNCFRGSDSRTSCVDSHMSPMKAQRQLRDYDISDNTNSNSNNCYMYRDDDLHLGTSTLERTRTLGSLNKMISVHIRTSKRKISNFWKVHRLKEMKLCGSQLSQLCCGVQPLQSCHVQSVQSCDMSPLQSCSVRPLQLRGVQSLQSCGVLPMKLHDVQPKHALIVYQIKNSKSANNEVQLLYYLSQVCSQVYSVRLVLCTSNYRQKRNVDRIKPSRYILLYV